MKVEQMYDRTVKFVKAQKKRNRSLTGRQIDRFESRQRQSLQRRKTN